MTTIIVPAACPRSLRSVQSYKYKIVKKLYHQKVNNFVTPSHAIARLSLISQETESSAIRGQYLCNTIVCNDVRGYSDILCVPCFKSADQRCSQQDVGITFVITHSQKTGLL